MSTEGNLAKKATVYGLFMAVVVVFGITVALGDAVVESNNALAQQQQQQNQTSIPHNAKGHESHQVIPFQNASEGIKYSGTVTFNLSKPADIISFEDITGKQPTTNTTKTWEIGDKVFAIKTLLKNVTQGSVNFNGSGIMAHNTQSDPYSSTFILDDAPINNNNSSR